MLGALRRIAVDLAIIVAVGLVVYSVLSNVWGGAYTISPIGAPEEFAKATQDKDGVAFALRAEIGRLLRDAQTGVAVRPLVPESTEPDLNVAGTNVPLRYIAGLIRDLIRLPHKKISGEISGVADGAAGEHRCLGSWHGRSRQEPGTLTRVHLVLQVADGAPGPLLDCVASYPVLLEQGGLAILAVVDPYAAATLLSKRSSEQDQTRARLLVLAALADARRREFPAWVQKWLPLWTSEIPRAHLALGNIYLREQNDQAALQEFLLANTEYAKRDYLSRGWHAAQDGLSIVHLNHGRHDASDYVVAERLARKALRLKSDFDSALYHLAQSYDFRARPALEKFTGVNCDTISNYKMAIEAYSDLLNQYPRFAIGHSQQATLMLQRWVYMASYGNDGCSLTVDTKELNEQLDTSSREIDTAFAMATSADPENYYPWLQWGILRLHQYRLQTRQNQTNTAGQRMLDNAISKLERASANPSDYYVWEQLGAAFALRRSLGEPGNLDDLKRRAVHAYCRAIVLAQAGDRARSERGLTAIGSSSESCAPP